MPKVSIAFITLLFTILNTSHILSINLPSVPHHGQILFSVVITLGIFCKRLRSTLTSCI